MSLCELCGRNQPLINDFVCGECRFKYENFELAIFLLNRCVELIQSACPDASYWTDELSKEIDGFLDRVTS